MTIEREDIDNKNLTNEQKRTKIIQARFVNCPRFKGFKVETWFLIIGNENNRLLTIKRFTMNKLLMNFILNFDAPSKPGFYKYKMYLMSDSYLGVDQEFDISFTIKEKSS